MREITYPDGETLYYEYDGGGLLKTAQGRKRGNPYPYIDKILYDEFGQRAELHYGNNVITTYMYDVMRRIKTLKTTVPGGRMVQDIRIFEE